MVSDPRMLGGFAGDYDRLAGETYFTEREAVVALYRALQRDGIRGVPPLPHQIWEPAAGGNAIAAELEAMGHDVHASDVVDWTDCYGYRPLKKRVPRRDFLADPGFEPFAGNYAIVTNPPFDDRTQGGRTAEMFLRAALRKPGCTSVWFLLRNDYDLSNRERPDLFDRPDYAMKICLRWRLSWTTPKGPIVSARTGEPEEARHNYAWYGWNLAARQRWPGARIVYADRPLLDASREGATRDAGALVENRDRSASPVRFPARQPVRHWQDKGDDE